MAEIVIAKYSRNKRWYRARIIGYDETEPCLKVRDIPVFNAGTEHTSLVVMKQNHA